MFHQKLLVLLGIWLIMPFAHSLEIKIVEGEIESIDAEFADADLKVREENGVNVVDFSFEFKKDLINETMIQVHIELIKQDKELLTIYNSSLVDRCHFVENRDKYPKLSAIYEQLEQYGNVMQTCPLLKGKYSVKGFKLTANSIIAMLPLGSYVTHFIMTKEIDGVIRIIYSIKLSFEAVE